MEAGRQSLDDVCRVYRESGSKEALDELVRAGQRLVCHFARIYTGCAGDDAVQAGMEGLLKAVKRFDPDNGASFTTYAGHYVMGEIRHYVRKESSYYRPGSILDLQNRVDKLVEDVLKTTGEPPALSEIAATLNVQEEGIVQAMRAGLVSLDEVDVRQIQCLRYETFKLPIEDRIVLQQAVNKLGELQKKVIYLLFYQDLTQTQAAQRLGISQRKVSRILQKSLAQMAKLIKP